MESRAKAFFYRNYWVYYLMAFLFLGLIIWLLFSFYSYHLIDSRLADKSIEKRTSECENHIIVVDSSSIFQDSTPQSPRENCRVHFSGLIMGGEFVEANISKIYKVDAYSEYVGSGNYKSNERAFPKAVATTFDGIAIDRNTRLIIYSKRNYQGQILLDVVGPAIINNVKWKNDERYRHCNYDNYERSLQETYPQSVRVWSKSDMHSWSYGSCKIICN
jgi:hypothetical protein